MMWWAVWCAAVAAAGAGAAAAPAPDSLAPLPPLDLVQIDQPAPDDESLGYAVPPMGGRYSGGGAPWLYYLAEPHDSQVLKKAGVWMRPRRGLSVNPAVEVLQRGAYNYYLSQIAHHNRDYLNCVGKRDPWSNDCKLKN
ncbi:diuretic hormone 41 isoform X3 [Pectinophora gossypiella]|uniref:diuretic hormone 41 isoform X3 n=1 Tax=Pectinophora gossypiella TaxID=13191 RepID=UPI00214F04D8|nr:diuretic hormone 41 isoform X3 [Pectinophora gossypiella]